TEAVTQAVIPEAAAGGYPGSIRPFLRTAFHGSRLSLRSAGMTINQSLHLQLDQRGLLEPAPEPRADPGGALGDIDRLLVFEPHRHVLPRHQDRAGLLSPQIPDAFHGAAAVARV